MILNNKKFIIPILSIALLSVMLNFVAAPLALADTTTVIPGQTAFEKSFIDKTSSIGAAVLLWPLNTVITAILLFLSWLVTIGGSVFDGSLAFSFSVLRQSAAIKAGWDISRNVANLFFILILLAIAISTILRVQSHNTKALLPKLIVVALLINFSLTMGYVIIDAANILGLQFYNAITNNGNVSVTTKIMESTKLQNLFNIDPPPKTPKITNDGSLWAQLPAGTVLTTIGGILGGGIVCAVTACAAAVPIALSIATGGLLGAATNFIKNVAGLDFAQASLYFSEVLGTTIFMVPLIFVLFVGAAFVLIRSAILILLLILSPIAFISYVLPETESRLWKPWWEAFTNHAFFLPAFMFLLYISISFLIEIAKIVPAAAPIKSMPVLMLNMIAIVMLLASLLLSKKMGIYFAESVMKGATASRKWLTGFVGGVAARNLVAPIGKRLEQSEVMRRIGLASPTLGDYAKRGAGWLAGRGKAPEQAERMAKAALAQGKGTWGASFGKLNRAGREAMLKGMDEKQRGEFLATLPPALRTTADNIIASPQFSSKETKDYNKARMQYEINQAQLKGNLGDFMAGKSDKEMPQYFGAMSEGQKVALLEEWNKAPDTERPALLDKFVTLTKAKTEPEGEGLSLEDSEKFRQSLRGASGATVSAYVNHKKLIGDAREKTIKSLSPTQLAYLHNEYLGDKSDEGTKNLKYLENITDNLAPDVKQQYYKAVGETFSQKSPADFAAIVPSLSENTLIGFIRSRPAERNIALINDPDMKGARGKILKTIKSAGLKNQYAKLVDPLNKVRYLDDTPEDIDADKLTENVATEIRSRTAEELAKSVSVETMSEKIFQEALAKEANLEQVVALSNSPAKIKIFNKIRKDIKLNNTLENQLKKLKERPEAPLSPVQQAFSEQID